VAPALVVPPQLAALVVPEWQPAAAAMTKAAVAAADSVTDTRECMADPVPSSRRNYW
jgi:hypothetical protein